MDNPIGICVDRNPFSSVEELVAMIAESGFRRVEWFEQNADDPWSSPSMAARLQALVRRRQVTPQYHAPYEAPFDLAWDDRGLRTPQGVAAVVSAVLDKAERLGARLMTLHLGTCKVSADRSEALRNVVEGIRLALPELERRRIRVALENHTQAIIESALGDRPEDIDWAMESLPSPWVGRTLDVGHAHINGHLEQFLARPFDRVFNMHLHDNLGSEDQHLPMGMGTIRWDMVLGRVAAERYRGPLTLEFFAAAEDYLRSMTLIRQYDKL